MSLPNIKKHTQNKISINYFQALIIVLLYLLIIYLGIHYCPRPIKQESVKFFQRMMAIGINWVKQIKNYDLFYLCSLIFFTSLPLGIISWIYILYYRLRTASTLDFPVISKYLPIPSVANPLYDEAFIKTKRKVREITRRLKKTERELLGIQNDCKKITEERDKYQTKSAETEIVKNNYLTELNSLINKSYEMHLETEHYKFIFKEGLKLLSYVVKFRDFVKLHLKDNIPAIAYEFNKVVNEFANTITKITVDRINDKNSSIMILSGDQEYLEMIAGNGLAPGTQTKFTRGQGIVGWVWESKQPIVCPNANKDSRLWKKGSPSFEFSSVIGVPITDFYDEVLGAMFVECNRENVFDEIKDTFTLSYFGEILAIIFIDFIALRMARGQKMQRNTI